MNFSSLLLYYAIYLLLTMLLFVVLRRKIMAKSSSLYMFLSAVFLGLTTPFLLIIFGALLTIGFLVVFSILLSLTFIFFTIRQERLAAAELEQTAGDLLEELPSYTEITETKENFIAEDASNPIEVTKSEEISETVQQPDVSTLEDPQDDEYQSERLHIPRVIPNQNINHEPDHVIEDDFILPGFAEEEILPLPESEASPVMPLPEDDEEGILRFRSDDEPIGNEQPYEDPAESIDEFPTFDDLEGEFQFVGEGASFTGNKEEAMEEPEQHSHKGTVEEEDKDYLAFLEEVLEEEGLANEDKTK